jgi:hypothetical protein
MSVIDWQAGSVRLARARVGAKAVSSRIGLDLCLMWASVVAFIGVTVWWLTQDDRVQDWDNGLHTMIAFGIRNELAAGNLTMPFTQWNTYPPFGHIIGALGVFVGGFHPESVILAENLVFIPLLAASCYGVGRLAYHSTRAGLLAAIFALGVPMIVSEAHEFLLDPQQAAMVAASVWAILASRRFDRVGVAALAGLLTGLAMLTKETTVLFVVGPLLVVLGRGGWRHWQGVLLFFIVTAAVAAPWYLYHLSQLQAWSATNETAGAASTYTVAPRFSRESLTYYFWTALNVQLLVPLAALFAVGTLRALWDCRRRPHPDDVRPELLAGVFVSWVGLTMVVHKDPRYSLPMLIFVAVLATGWIPRAGRLARRTATAAVVLIAAINLLGISTGTGGPVQVSLPGRTAGLFERELTFYSPDGWLRGGPGTDGHLPSLMSGLRAAGIQTVTFDGSDTEDFNTSGLQVRAIEAGVTPASVYDPANLGPHGAFLLRHVRVAGDPPPCRTLEDGSGVYVVLKNALQPFVDYTFICPGRRPEIYRRTAPLSPAMVVQGEAQLPEPYRDQIATIMRAMRRQGVVEVQFDPASENVPFFAPGPLQNMALSTGLTLPSTYAPGSLGPHDAFMLRHLDGVGNPPPCLRFPDGSGLYIVLGDALMPFSSYTLYCPTRHPREYPATTG